jgi:hypothetical protein
VGQVWRYRPTSIARGDLVLVFESPSREVLDYPDNITVSPRGGIVICEDGEGEQFLRLLLVNIMGFTRDGGAEQGRTLAIRGPWERGAL